MMFHKTLSAQNVFLGPSLRDVGEQFLKILVLMLITCGVLVAVRWLMGSVADAGGVPKSSPKEVEPTGPTRVGRREAGGTSSVSYGPLVVLDSATNGTSIPFACVGGNSPLVGFSNDNDGIETYRVLSLQVGPNLNVSSHGVRSLGVGNVGLGPVMVTSEGGAFSLWNNMSGILFGERASPSGQVTNFGNMNLPGGGFVKAATSLSDGALGVVYVDQLADNSILSFRRATVNGTGVSWSNATRISVLPVNGADRVALANITGDLLVTYSVGVVSSGDIVMARFNDRGDILFSEALVTSSSITNEYDSAILSFQNGTALVAWTSYGSGPAGLDGADAGVQARLVFPDGRLGSVFVVNLEHTASSQFGPAGSVFSSGRDGIIGFTDNQRPGGGARSVVAKALRLIGGGDLNSTVLLSSDFFLDNQLPGVNSRLVACPLSDDRVLLSWVNQASFQSRGVIAVRVVQLPSDRSSSESSSSAGSLVIPIAAAAGGVLLVVVIAGVAYVIRRNPTVRPPNPGVFMEDVANPMYRGGVPAPGLYASQEDGDPNHGFYSLASSSVSGGYLMVSGASASDHTSTSPDLLGRPGDPHYEAVDYEALGGLTGPDGYEIPQPMRSTSSAYAVPNPVNLYGELAPGQYAPLRVPYARDPDAQARPPVTPPDTDQ